MLSKSSGVVHLCWSSRLSPAQCLTYPIPPSQPLYATVEAKYCDSSLEMSLYQYVIVDTLCIVIRKKGVERRDCRCTPGRTRTFGQTFGQDIAEVGNPPSFLRHSIPAISGYLRSWLCDGCVLHWSCLLLKSTSGLRASWRQAEECSSL